MLYIAVCDDDKTVCTEIEDALIEYSKQHCMKNKVEVFYSGESLLEYMEKGNNFDLLYLDIEMGHINGVEVGRRLRRVYKNYSIEIVYISANDGYDRQLFEVQPLHFIAKPIDASVVIKDLELAIERGQRLGGFFKYKKGYDIIYILGNLFMAYVIYHYMHVFYTFCKVSGVIERFCYIGYFIGITLVHTFLEIPIIVLVTNLLFVTLLTFLYDDNIKKLLLTTVIICFSLTLIETIIAFITSKLQLNILVPFEYESEFGIVLIRLFSLAFEIVGKDDRELYAYGFWQGGVMLVNFLTVAIIGIITGMFWQSAVFTIVYGLLRTVAGGFHARTQSKCYICSILLLVLVLGILRWEQWNAMICILVVLMSGKIVFKLAPVEDENKPLDDVEVVVYKHRSRIICTMLAIAVFILLLINEIEIASCITVSILAASVMLILGEVRNRYVDAKY